MGYAHKRFRALQLAPARQPDTQDEAYCESCHHVTLVHAPYIVGVLSEDWKHWDEVEYRMGALCTNPECKVTSWVT